MTEDVDLIPKAQVEYKFGNLDALFEIADKNHDGYIDTLEARDFFPQFGLPASFLSVVWRNCVNQPEGMNGEEFIRAMKFMYMEMEKQHQPQQQQQQQQQTLSQQSSVKGITPSPPPPPPTTHLQTESNISNSPSMAMMMMGDDQQQTTYPPVNYSITPQERSNYESHYHKLVGYQNMISGMQAKDFFLQSKLDNVTLKQIWQLADIERRGMLDKEEFCIAMHLVRLQVKNRNFVIPSQLPRELLPPGKVMPSTMMGFGDDMPNFNGAPTSATPTSEFTTPLHSARATPVPQGIPSQRTGPNMTTTMTPPAPSESYGFGAHPSTMSSVEKSTFVIKGTRALHDSVQILLNETKDLSTNMFTSQNQVTDRKEQLEMLEREEKELKQKSKELKEQVERQRAERDRLGELVSTFRSKTELLKQERELFERELSGLMGEIDRLKNVKDHGEGSSLGLMREVQELEAQVRYNQQQLIKQRDAISQSKNSHDSNLSIQRELEHEVKNLKQQLAMSQEELKGISTEVDEIKSKIAFFGSAKNEYSKATEQTQSQIQVVLRQKQDLTKQLDDCKKELAEFEKQFSSTGNKAKHARLVSIVETTTDFLKEFEKLMGEQKEEASKAPVTTKQSNVSVSTTSPATSVSGVSTGSETVPTNGLEKGFDEFVEQKPAAAAAAPSQTSSLGFGENDGFDDFSAQDVVPGNVVDENTTKSAPDSTPKETSEFDDAFDTPKSGSLPNPPKKTEESPIGASFDDAFNDFGISNDDGWGDEFADFKNNNSSTTKSSGLDDFGFGDDFGSSTSTVKDSSSTTTKSQVANDDWATDFDDFA